MTIKQDPPYELAPKCRKCGGAPSILMVMIDNREHFNIHCSNCGAAPKPNVYLQKEAARYAWKELQKAE